MQDLQLDEILAEDTNRDNNIILCSFHGMLKLKVFNKI